MTEHRISDALRREFHDSLARINEKDRLLRYFDIRRKVQRCDGFILTCITRRALKAIQRSRDPGEWSAAEHYCVQMAIDLTE